MLSEPYAVTEIVRVPLLPTDKLALGGVASLVNVGFVAMSDLFPLASSAHAVIVYVPSVVIVNLPLVPVIVFSVPFSVYFSFVALVSVAVSDMFTVTVPM